MSDQHPEPEIPPVGARLDELAPAPAATTRRPLAKAALTAMAGLLVIGAVGIAIVTLSAGDGSASAEGAVHRLFEAVDRQDAIGVAESLEPTERRILVTTLKDAADEAHRVKVVDDRLDLRAVDGVDLTVDGVQLQVTPLDDQTSAVDITSGRISSRTQLSKMPIGPVVQEVIDRSEEAGDEVDDASHDEIDLTGTRIVAVERGGEWYVSALFSLAEQVRLDGDPVAAYPSKDSAIPAIGADSPEAAVREGITAATGADVRRLIELTPADEARVLHTYGPILVDGAKGETTGVKVDDLKLRVDDASDGRKRVSATSMTMTVTSEWDRQVTTYDGKCSTTTWEVTDPEQYGYDTGSSRNNSWKQCDDEDTSLAPFGLFNVFYAPGSLDIIVEEHDGKWFLSPTGTLVQNTVGVVKGLDANAVRRIARAWSGEWWLYENPELWDACGVAQPGLDDTRSEAEAAYERCMESLPQDYTGAWGPMGDISTGSSDGVLSVPGEACPYPGNEEPSTNAEACIDGSNPDGSTPGGGVTYGPGATVPESVPASIPAPSTTITRPPSTTTAPPMATTTTTQP